MAARAHRLLLPPAFHRSVIPHAPLHLLPPLLSTAICSGGRHRRVRAQLIVGRMASGGSQAPSSTARITLPGGNSIEVVAAPGVSDSDLRNAISSSLFKQWLKNMQSDTGLLAGGHMSLRQVYIQGVDMFGRGVGFLKFKADVFDKETKAKIPGIVFARGPAVSVLILLESRGKTFVVLTEQPRVPVGRLILELPAGMIDDEGGDVVGTAVREVEEEIGIHLNKEDMVNLTAFLDPVTGCKVFPSPGGCDEELSLFLYRGHVEEEILSALQGKEMGLRDHGELIKVHVVPYETLWRVTADAKALAAIALYEMAKRNGLLP
ncbi:NUDIX domain [Musa troglodytarum]|uniref:NUDIX domain n=1 Tax=Musa troglodytarum TaxID=320322 RepID=A0A9E7FTC0_9LILI|nr:NUDIX domain [Musa troglodytarum]